jgi:hypothetical protein
MTIDELERRLRIPAPDEPAMLPPLLLPMHLATERLAERRIDLRLGSRRRTMPMVLLGTALLLVATLVTALLVGALRLEQVRDALPIPGMYTGRGITLDYPDDWTVFTPRGPLSTSGAWVALIAGNRAVDGCEPDSEAVARNSPPPQPEPSDGVVNLGGQQGVIFSLEDRIYACLIEQPLVPGEVRLVVSRDRPQAIGVGPIGDFTGSWLAPNPDVGAPVLVSGETGFTETVGDMPARLIVRDRSVVPGAEELRTWFVAIPRSADALWWVQAVMRGPDLAALEAEVDAIARSLAFDEAPMPLAEAERDAAVAAAIDSVDRAMRQYPGRRFLGCMPRTPGSATATISDGPRGRLARPLRVTCTTTVDSNDLRLWTATLEVAWDASGGVAAGRWARQLLLDGEGNVQMETDLAPGTGEPLAFPGDPSAVDDTTETPTFSPGDLVRSIGSGAGSAFNDVDSTRLPPEPHLFAEPGDLLVILSGPATYDDRDFYLADDGAEVGWVGAEAKGRALLAPATALCPSSLDVTELTYVSALERRRCVTGEVTLGPVQAGRVELDPSWGEVESDPAWLAGEPGWALFGEPAGDRLDAGLPVVLAPGLEELPSDGWLVVRGHFDDPASAGCTTSYPAEWDRPPLPPEAETRRCLERFVVTSAEATEGP